jgi:hypothetical protein|nr:MAG TPA: Major tail protein [Caudoviricetes sp.]
MYIAPNTTIVILKNVPLDNNYRNTIYFTNSANQNAYFAGKMKYRVDRNSYQRLQNTIKIGINAENLYDCNYLMYQNTAFGNKWFYAFITSVEYKNNDMSEITFEIDVMQTWAFDYDLRMSFVEREHSVTDKIGDNLVPENLELGDYVYTDLGLTSLFDLYQIVMACTFDTNLNDAAGGMYGGVYSGLTYNVFSSFTAANDFIEEVTAQNKIDGIVSIFMLPVAFCYDFQTTIPQVYNITRDKHLSSIDGYIPKNNKLFTYPYNMLYVTNNEGLAANYAFEYFGEDACNFNVSGAMCCTPEVMLTPLKYKGVDKNYNEKLTIGNFPQCAFTVDTFKAYVAQNANRLAIDAATGVAQTVAGGAAMYATGGVLGAGTALGGIEKIGSLVATLSDKSTLPPQARGGHSSIINMANQIKGFQFYYAYIRQEFAKIIDDYFNVYGYATHRVKIPNRVIRPHWNYVKTVNVNVTGSVPADDLAKIRSIYDNGTTFWRNGNEVGDYSLDNGVNA